PLAVAMVRRWGACAALFPAAVVAFADLVRFELGGPGFVGWVNVAAGLMVPYLLGIAWARGGFPGRLTTGRTRIRGAARAGALGHRGGRGDGGAGRGGGIPGEHGRRQRRGDFDPEPAHARRRDLRRRPGWPGPAAAGAAGPVDAPPAGVGGGRHGQPVGDDAVPVAPDPVPRRHPD